MNKIKLEIYNPTKTYLYPNMNIATPEDIQANYSAVNISKCVVGTDMDGLMFYSVELLSAMVQRLGVNKDLYENDEELLLALEDVLNTPPEPQEYEISAEERIAAAMEYQNLML